MSWESVLKKLPNNLDDLSYKINGKQASFDRLLRTIEKFPKLTPGFKKVMAQFANGSLTVDSFYKDLAPGLDPEKLGLAPKAVAQERLDLLLSKLNLTEETSPEKIVDEGLELLAQEERDEAKISEMAEKIKNLTLRGDKNRKRRNIQRKIDVFLRNFNKSEITFKKIPEKGEEKREFLRLIEEFSQIPKEKVEIDEKETIIPIGTVSGNKILSNFKSFKEFQQFMNENEQAMKFYRENLRKYGTDLTGIDAPSESDSPKAELEERFVRGVRYQSVEFQNYVQVNDYLEILESAPIAVTKFMPKEMKSGGFLPVNFFLTPESSRNASERASKSRERRGEKPSKAQDSANRRQTTVRRLNLNPYANTILRQTFVGEDWFRDFFETVRIAEGTKEDLADRMLYEDIYSMLRFPAYKSVFGFDRGDFAGLEVKSLDVDSGVSKIRGFIRDNRDLSREFRNRSLDYRDNRISDDLIYFTPSEAKAIMETDLWDQLEIEDGFDFIPLVYGREESGEGFILTDELVESKDPNKAVFFKLTKDDIEYSPEDFDKYLADAQLPKFEGPIQQIRRFLGDQGVEFSTYLISLGDKLQELVDSPVADTAFYLEKMNPDSSIQFFSKMSERMGTRNMPLREDLLAIVQEDTISGKQKRADELNIKMPEYLMQIKEEMYSAFTIALNKFGQNYVNYSRKPQAILEIIESFKEKGLLTGGE